MSQQALADFLTHLASDAEAAKALGAATDGLEGDAAFNAVAAFASENGFDVGPDDARAVHEAYARLAPEDGELPDAALEDVAGGMMMPQDARIWGKALHDAGKLMDQLFSKW